MKPKDFFLKHHLHLVAMFMLVFLFSTLAGQAQKLIARQSGSTTTFHTTIDDAITQANNDDILYLPGGYFDLTVPITKKIHIYGEGHNPKYSVANGTTIIGGGFGFKLKNGASGSTIQGIYFVAALWLEQSANNITFSRCNISSIYLDESDGQFREYLSLNECIVRDRIDCDLQYGVFSYCIFQCNFFRHQRNHNFRNCIFLAQYDTFGYPYDNTRKGIDYSRFDKCIFKSGFGGAGFCYFYDNIINGPEDNVQLDQTNLIGANNKYAPWETLFEKQSGFAFTYDQDYHLKTIPEGIPSDIGIHGGSSPWKENCFPMNPQIITKKISGYTDANGNLKVEIAVEAQQK